MALKVHPFFYRLQVKLQRYTNSQSIGHSNKQKRDLLVGHIVFPFYFAKLCIEKVFHR